MKTILVIHKTIVRNIPNVTALFLATPGEEIHSEPTAMLRKTAYSQNFENELGTFVVLQKNAINPQPLAFNLSCLLLKSNTAVTNRLEYTICKSSRLFFFLIKSKKSCLNYFRF